MTYIKRNIDEVIQDWFNGDKRSLLILGARQIGKSESIKQFLRGLYDIEDDSRLPLLDIENTPGVKDAIVTGQSEGGPSFIRNLFANARIDADLDVCKIVFIDEVQAISTSKKLKAEGEIKTVLSRLMEETEFRFIFSGSLLGAKISNLEELTSELPGGVMHARMFPISFAEFVEHIDGDGRMLETAKRELLESKTISREVHIHLLKRFGEYSFIGGMPKSQLAYFKDGKHSVADSMDAISALKADYIHDAQKYYQEELGVEIGDGVFDWLLLRIGETDKEAFKKKFKLDPEKTLYQFIVDSDIGLLVSHIEEYSSPLEEQAKPKTFFNDVGFMRLMIQEHLDEAGKYENLPDKLRQYYDVRPLEEAKQDYLKYIEHEGGTTFRGAGRYFEQVVAQSIKEKSYVYAYKDSTNPEMELEFILPDDLSAIEVKSGGFEDYPSSRDYAAQGNRVFFLSLLPYVGELKDNFFLLPVYSVCILNQDELTGIAFNKADPVVGEILDSGRLPEHAGFYHE